MVDCRRSNTVGELIKNDNKYCHVRHGLGIDLTHVEEVKS